MSDVANVVETAPDKRRTKFRNLRIAVSVFFGLLTVAFALLWARSYSYVTFAELTTDSGHVFKVTSRFGRFYFRTYVLSAADISLGEQMVSRVHEIHKSEQGFEIWKPNPVRLQPPRFQFAFGATNRDGELTIRFPYWFAVLLSGLLAVAAGFRRLYHFSLRTMLTATTLVAVALGMAVWMLR